MCLLGAPAATAAAAENSWQLTQTELTQSASVSGVFSRPEPPRTSSHASSAVAKSVLLKRCILMCVSMGVEYHEVKT